MQLWYAYAKTTAEKEAWKFAKENGIDLVVVNPSFVVGPLLAPQPTSTLLMVLSIVKGQKEYKSEIRFKSPPQFFPELQASIVICYQFPQPCLLGSIAEYPNTTVGFVHIDDVIAAHMLAMEENKASGRLVCSSSVAHWSQIIEMLRPKYPAYPFLSK